MDKKTELKGLIKDQLEDSTSGMKAEWAEKAAKLEEDNAKLFESNTKLKAQFDAMQDKSLTLVQNTGTNKYIIKGYNVNMPSRNFRMDVSVDQQEEAAAGMLKALAGGTGDYATQTEYSNTLLGLGELSSAVLGRCKVLDVGAPIVKLPSKATRATVDTQSFGTANTAAATDLGQTTWTIDKRIGAYETLYNDILQDQIFDIVGEFIEPMIAEAIGQDLDDKAFNDTDAVFTTTIGADCTTDVTISGSVGMAAGITFANLNTLYNTIEWARGISNAEWFGPQGALKDVMALVDSNGRPIFQQLPVNGLPSHMLMGSRFNVTPDISNTPADGKIRLAFGDPSKYIVMKRGNIVFEVNPYVSMKEGAKQFIGYIRCDANLTAGTAFTTLKRAD